MNRPLRSRRARGPRLVAGAVGLVTALFTLEVGAEDRLYGMNDVGQPGGPDELVQLDRNTGVATRLHVFTSASYRFLESLAYDARENVLWTTNDGVLVRVQPGTFIAHIVGDTGLDDIDGLAVQPSTGTLFGITYGGNDLVRIDKSDGGATIVNPSLEAGSRLEDLAFDSTGRLYVLTSRNLVEVNPATGVRISKVRLQGASSLEGLVWDPERGTFLSAADRGRYKDLVTINRSTGQVAFVSATQNSGFKDIEALAFVPGPPIVPVAMQVLPSAREDAGVRLAWEAYAITDRFTVARAVRADGIWSEIARVDAPVGGRAGAHRYEYLDREAASLDAALLYRVGAQDEAGLWSWIEFEIDAAPARGVELRPCRPNPFNPTTVFEVHLERPATVHLAIYDVRGRVVRQIRSDLGAGTHVLPWDGRDDRGSALAGGVYPYVLTAGGRTLRDRAVLVK